MTTTIAPADMVLFVAVARAASFTRAGAELGLSKQTVSERIARLEAALGVRLIERTTRRLRLTEAGGAYFERCAAIAGQIDEANDEARRFQREPVGTLRVSAPVLYGRRFLGPVVAEFLRRHDRVRVELVLADRRVDLVAEGFDLALRVGQLDDSSLTSRKIDDGHVHFVASPRLLARLGVPTPSTLARFPRIAHQPFEAWSVAGVTVTAPPALVVNDLESMCDAAVAGLGVARLPAIVCHEAVRAGRLRVLFGPEPALATGLYAVYPSRLHLPLIVRRFVDVLVEVAAPMRPLAPPRRPRGARRPAR